jgi:Ca-activated chloride channel family protein
MFGSLRASITSVTFLGAIAALSAAPRPGAPARAQTGPSRFRNGVEIVNVTATVTNVATGRFVSGLQEDDFTVFDNDEKQPIAQFSTERLPVSLGIALDTSGSMAGAKIEEARAALDRFLEQLLDPGDEIFLYRFSDYPSLLEGWTTSRTARGSAHEHIKPDGGTALYDTVRDAVPLASQGKNRKKALVIISDGNDTSSNTPLVDIRRVIREGDVLVYAVGIDSVSSGLPSAAPPAPAYPPVPPRGGSRPQAPIPGRRPGLFVQLDPRGRRAAASNDRVNAAALRELTDESGGRTEIIRDPRDLQPATAGIADELSRQYDVSYISNGKKDGAWHNIRVEVRNPSFLVRARRGYIAN